MEIQVRVMKDEDLLACEAVEYSATNGNLLYLRDVYDYYTSTKGEMSVALVDGKIVGIGKLSILFDGSAWLECLRVTKEYQQKGVGTAIYQRYMEQIKAYDCHLAGLYTGIKNIGSVTLAENHGFHKDTFYKSFSTTEFGDEKTVDFKMSKDLTANNFKIKHLNINHTFYQVNEKNIRGLASQGYIYQNEDTILVFGSRFQPEKALYIAYIQGDENAALAYALKMAKLRGTNKVIYHMPANQKENQELLEKYHFKADPGQDLVMTLED